MAKSSVSTTSPPSSSQVVFSKSKKVLGIAATVMLATAIAPTSALAAASSAKKLHAGQKLATFFQVRTKLPPLGILFLISAMPIVELRGAVPVGVWMGVPIQKVFVTCVLGNMAPIIPLLFLLKNERVKTLMKPILDKAATKTTSITKSDKKWTALAAFVGIPLPGTGAWTGAMVAFLLNMPLTSSISSIFCGVVSAGIIMSSITLAGKAGGVAVGVVLAAFAAKSLGGVRGSGKQDFLEASPYHDQSKVPVNTFKNANPHVGKVVSTKRIVGPNATGETCHIIIDHAKKMPYWEGQSFGVLPPGVREKDGKPNSVRLYSIAASRYGDDMTGQTTSLCVRRATYWCPELKADDPAKKGICSNFLCDSTPGTEIRLTGPTGKVMLMPEDKPDTDLIMVATGTGIAPYRAFIRRLFAEDTQAAAAYKGQAWLFLGVANSDALLYDDEWQVALKSHPNNFRLDYALSREAENKKGGKMYIQDKVEEYADEVFTKLDTGAHIYFCGLKGMMPGIQDMLKEVCKEKNIDYDEWLGGLKKNKQWHVEVY